MFGVDGPFLSKSEGEPSAFQIHMQRVGLPVVTVKATDFRITSGNTTLLQLLVCFKSLGLVLLTLLGIIKDAQSKPAPSADPLKFEHNLNLSA